MIELLAVLEDLDSWISPDVVVLAKSSLLRAVYPGQPNIQFHLLQGLSSSLIPRGKLLTMSTEVLLVKFRSPYR